MILQEETSVTFTTRIVAARYLSSLHFASAAQFSRQDALENISIPDKFYFDYEAGANYSFDHVSVSD